MRLLGIVALAATLGGCASVTRGTTENISISSTPAGAEATIPDPAHGNGHDDEHGHGHGDGHHFADPDGDGSIKTAGSGAGSLGVGGFIGMGLIGAAVSQITRPVGLAMGVYGAVRTMYTNVLAKGKDVSFPADTPIEVQLAPGPTPAAR